MKNIKTLLAVALVAGTLPTFAAKTGDTAVWTGAAGDNLWNTSSVNWKDKTTSENRAFVNGDNATITVKSGATTIKLGEDALQPYKTVFDVGEGAGLTLNGNGKKNFGKGASGFTKNGSGKLTVTSSSEAGFIYTFGPAGFVINGGEVEFNKKKILTTVAAAENPIIVKDGATLTFSAANLPAALSETAVALPIIVSNGTFKLTNTAATHHQLGPLSLSNGTFDYSTLPGQNNELGLFTLTGKLSLSGDTPYVFTTTDANQRKFFAVWHDPYTEFEVADITGNVDPDFTVDMRIHNSCTQTGSAGRQVGGFVKTGDGTMLLNVYTNSFTGNIEVRGGTLQAGVAASTQMKNTYTGGWSHFGDLSVGGRMCTVYTNATVYLPNRQNFGAYEADGNVLGTDFTFVLDGGVLKFQEGCENAIPNLTVRNGGSIFDNAGSSYNGRLMVAGTFKVDGSVPFVWAGNPDEENFNDSLALNANSQTVFDIADVTGDSAVDADFGRDLIVHLSTWKLSPRPTVGFRKIGSGTMRLSHTGSGRSFNGVATVEAGALVLDGGSAALASDIVVNAGAAVGGSGTVSHVTMADGASWRVDAAQSGAMTIAGAFSVPATGTIEVVGAGELQAKVGMLVAQGGLENAGNFANWTVKLNGTVVPDWSIRVSGNKVSVGPRKGLILVVQ